MAKAADFKAKSPFGGESFVVMGPPGHCNTIVRRRMTLLCVQLPTTHLAALVAAEKVNMATLIDTVSQY